MHIIQSSGLLQPHRLGSCAYVLITLGPHFALLRMPPVLSCCRRTPPHATCVVWSSSHSSACHLCCLVLSSHSSACHLCYLVLSSHSSACHLCLGKVSPRLNGHNLSDASASDVSETCGANREGGEERRSEKERGRREDGERIWRGACLTLLLLPLPPCFVERGRRHPKKCRPMGYSPEVESPKPPRALTYHGLLT